MVVQCSITEDNALIGLSISNITEGNFTVLARECYEDYTSLPETILFGIYSLFAMIFGIGGNLIVILATLKYTVFSLDSITMVFVRHLAIADIFYVVIRIFPTVTVHFSRGWVMGKALCFVVANTVTISTLASMHFILTVSIHRLLRCLFPLRFSLSVRNKATVLAMILWGYSSIGSVISIATGIDIYFRPVIAGCDVDYSSNVPVSVGGVVIQMLVPFTGIVLINIAMYIIARQRFKDLSNNQALMTVASVSGLFIISWLPSILSILLGVSGFEAKSLIWLDKLQINFYFLSVFGNPFLYSFVHKGFGRFAKSKFAIFLRKCQDSMEAQWQNSVSKSSEHNAGEGEPRDLEKKLGDSRKDTESTFLSKTASREVINAPVMNNKQPTILEEDEMVKSSNQDSSFSNNYDLSKDSGHCSSSVN